MIGLAPALALALALGCADQAPAALPPVARVQPTASGRMVRSGVVRGYIARPLVEGAERAATLLLVEQQDEATRAATLAVAEAGGVALAVTAEVDPLAAHAYLDGMPDVASVTVDCRRVSCP